MIHTVRMRCMSHHPLTDILIFSHGIYRKPGIHFDNYPCTNPCNLCQVSLIDDIRHRVVPAERHDMDALAERLQLTYNTC